ncbi:MAG: hypothetical protein JWR21_2245 [Herminiimonas sp.]|nr:hypothetical protein [Herminiimonas sp.]
MRDLAPVVMDAPNAISHDLGYRGQVQRYAERGPETVAHP